MVAWRWNVIPANFVEKTIFKHINTERYKDIASRYGGLLESTFKKEDIKAKAAASGGDAGKPNKADEGAPVVLDRSRCTVIGMAERRFVIRTS
jgi:hypothetical protein